MLKIRYKYLLTKYNNDLYFCLISFQAFFKKKKAWNNISNIISYLVCATPMICFQSLLFTIVTKSYTNIVVIDL